MTEGNQGEASRQLNENKEANENPVQDISEQQTEDSSQLQSAPGNNLFRRRLRVSLDIENVSDGLLCRNDRNIIKARYDIFGCHFGRVF